MGEIFSDVLHLLRYTLAMTSAAEQINVIAAELDIDHAKASALALAEIAAARETEAQAKELSLQRQKAAETIGGITMRLNELKHLHDENRAAIEEAKRTLAIEVERGNSLIADGERQLLELQAAFHAATAEINARRAMNEAQSSEIDVEIEAIQVRKTEAVAEAVAVG